VGYRSLRSSGGHFNVSVSNDGEKEDARRMQKNQDRNSSRPMNKGPSYLRRGEGNDHTRKKKGKRK